VKPYWTSADGRHTLYHGDCLAVLPTLGKVDAVVTDPPYGKVKGDFDEAWTNRSAMLPDCRRWLLAMVPTMKPNATLWWFAWPSLAGRIEALISTRLNVLAHVVWIKPTSTAQKHCPEALRAPGPETERIIMAEHYGADNKALGASGYVAKCDEARGFIFEPLRRYLADEMTAAGHTCASINRAWQARKGNKGGMASHWFTDSQWQLPTREHYEWLRELFNGQHLRREYEHLRREYEHLRREYEHLRREYEDLRREYEDLRRYFALEQGDPKTDIWRFAPSGNASGHPTEKPVALMAFIVRTSARPDSLVLDPFCGSGTTGVACVRTGRRSIGIEMEERYCEIAARRMEAELAQPMLIPPAETRETQGDLL
jgi:adenine-specific DNA-methyltransferase